MEPVSYHSSRESLHSLTIHTTQVPLLRMCLLVYSHETLKAPDLIYMFAFFPSTLPPSFPAMFLCSLPPLFFNITAQISEGENSWCEYKEHEELQLAKGCQQVIKKDKLNPEVTKAHGGKNQSIF